MDIILIMCVGILAGKYLPLKKWKGLNEKIQLTCTLLLIFSMGVMLGRKDNFLSELSSLGKVSFLFFLIPTVLSVILVYHLTSRFMEKKHGKEKK